MVILGLSVSEKQAFHGVIQQYHNHFHAYFRISVGQFELLLAELGLHVRQGNIFREPIDLEQI